MMNGRLNYVGHVEKKLFVNKTKNEKKFFMISRSNDSVSRKSDFEYETHFICTILNLKYIHWIDIIY